MANKFNSYIENIDTEFIKEICISKGKVVQLHRNDFFVKEKEIFPYIGFVDTGVLKYTCTNIAENKNYNTGFRIAAYPI